MITNQYPSPMRYIGQCRHCKGEMWFNEDTEKIISRSLPDCLCETKEGERIEEEDR